MKFTILVITLLLTGYVATQAQADQLAITSNLSTIRITGSVDDFLTGEHDGYTDGVVYSSSNIPLKIDQNVDKDTTIATANADSRAELSLDIDETEFGYRIYGAASSTANTEVNSLDDNDATANSEAVVDLAFILTSNHSFTFSSDVFNSKGTGESELELINTTTGTVFSQVISENIIYRNHINQQLKSGFKKVGLWDRFKVSVIVLKCTRELFFTSNNHAQQRDQCFFLRFGLICGQSPGKSSDKVALVMSHRTFEKAKLMRPFTR